MCLGHVAGPPTLSTGTVRGSRRTARSMCKEQSIPHTISQRSCRCRSAYVDTQGEGTRPHPHSRVVGRCLTPSVFSRYTRGRPSHTVSRCVTLLPFLLSVTTPTAPGWGHTNRLRPLRGCCSGRGAAKSRARRMRQNQSPHGGPPNSGRRCRSPPCSDMACFTSVSIAALPDAQSITDRMEPHVRHCNVHHTFRPASTIKKPTASALLQRSA